LQAGGHRFDPGWLHGRGPAPGSSMCAPWCMPRHRVESWRKAKAESCAVAARVPAEAGLAERSTIEVLGYLAWHGKRTKEPFEKGGASCRRTRRASSNPCRGQRGKRRGHCGREGSKARRPEPLDLSVMVLSVIGRSKGTCFAGAVTSRSLTGVPALDSGHEMSLARASRQDAAATACPSPRSGERRSTSSARPLSTS
jgi:hypothetical protein